MTVGGTLPALDDCLDAYLTAYERFETESFFSEELPISGERKTERVLELAVAYGLLEYDGDKYRVHVEPDAPAERWNAAATSRATAIRRRVTNRDTDERVDQPGDAERESEQLQREGRHYASVFIDEADRFETVARCVREAATTDGADGVVLRSTGQLANEVQQFADRLCQADGGAKTPLVEPFQKDDTDVEGDHKDELEFRLYLSRQ